MTRILVALGIVGALTFGVHRYLWARLVRDPGLPEPWGRALGAAIIVLGLMVPLGFIAVRTLPRAASTPIAWVVYTWLGVAFYAFLFVAGADLARVVVERFTGAPDPERRLFLARLLAGVAAGAAALVGGVGVATVARGFSLKRVRVPLARLPSGLSGYSIVQLSDVHVGPTIGREFIEKLVREANALEPDMVVITGDLVDGSVDELAHLVEPLRGLRAKDGVFFVTGNHEYYSGVDRWLAHLPTLGIRVLRNERVAIRGDVGFDLAGVDDASAARFGRGHGADLARALEGRDASRAVVLLAHQPKAASEAAQHGVDLQLSGHTHGGQLAPFHWLVKLDQPFLAGLHLLEQTYVYVSSGTGYWGPPMRVGTESEITRIELVNA